MKLKIRVNLGIKAEETTVPPSGGPRVVELLQGGQVCGTLSEYKVILS